MKKIDLAVIGGFLGAGKTTSILNIAKHLTEKGRKVGIVTNDQGSGLVDTNFLTKSGLTVLEVTGGCFCCNFDEFISKINELSENLLPDIILAEPVGSCTDLIATIFKPIMIKFTEKFMMSPLSVVADPRRIRKLMMEDPSSFPSEINYLFKKQLEEADIIVLNKVDTISMEQIADIVSFLKTKFKGIQVITVSAKEDYGIEDWISLISGKSAFQKPSLNINYETYAYAEECLGWLNSRFLVNSAVPHDANKFILELINEIKEELKKLNLEIAHLKVYEISGEDYAKASLTDIFDDVNFDREMKGHVMTASLIINARINALPETLQPVTLDALKKVAALNGIALSPIDLQCFKPGKPKPTHRIK